MKHLGLIVCNWHLGTLIRSWVIIRSLCKLKFIKSSTSCYYALPQSANLGLPTLRQTTLAVVGGCITVQLVSSFTSKDLLIFLFGQMLSCETLDQLYSVTSPNGECCMVEANKFHDQWLLSSANFVYTCFLGYLNDVRDCQAPNVHVTYLYTCIC